MKGPYIVKRMFSYQPEGPMFYIWHTDAKKKKFPITSESAQYYIDTDGALYLKSEYEPCDPPKSWTDVTSLLTASIESNVLLLNGFGTVRAHGTPNRPRRLRLVDAYKVSDFPLPASCLHVPFQRMIVLEEEGPTKS